MNARWGHRLLGLVLLIAAGWLLGTGAASAETLSVVSVRVSVRVPDQVLAQAGSVEQVLSNIRNWIMGIAAGLATVFATIGTVRWMAAGGDLGELEKAKTAFRSAAFGYALALLTPLLLTVLREIVGA